MASSVDLLKQQFDVLSVPERADLAYYLLASLEPADEGVDEAWRSEVNRRVEEIHAGKVSGTPADVLFAELRRQYP